VGADTFWGLSATAWTGITSLLTAGLLGVAVVAAIYAKGQWDSARAQIENAREQAREARKAELEARRPYVIVTVEHSEVSKQLFDLVVRNIGQRPAVTVSISLDPPPVRARETDGFPLSNAKMLTEPVAMIAPGQEMRAFYDSHIDRNGRDDLPTSHKVLLSYQDSSGHQYTETSVIDIHPMKGAMHTTVKTVHDIGKSLEEIQKTLKHAPVLGSHGTLEVSVERRAEKQERLAAEWEERRRHHEGLVRQLLPDGTDAEKAGDPSAHPRPDADQPHHDVSPTPDEADTGAAQG
jgi:hypothetical protein